MSNRRACMLMLLFLSVCVSCGTTEDPPEDPPATPDDCPEFTGSPLEHSGSLVGDEAWGPGHHLVTSSVFVGAGSKLTIEPCAVVRVAADQGIEVDDESVGLVAIGTERKPIIFERAESARAWGSIAVFAPVTIELEHVTLRGAGTEHANPLDANYSGATLAARNLRPDPTDSILVKNVVIEDSNGVGVMLVGAGFISGSSDLTVTGAGSYPVYLGAGHATNLPTGTYVGNGNNSFLLQTIGAAV